EFVGGDDVPSSWHHLDITVTHDPLCGTTLSRSPVRKVPAVEQHDCVRGRIGVGSSGRDDRRRSLRRWKWRGLLADRWAGRDAENVLLADAFQVCCRVPVVCVSHLDVSRPIEPELGRRRVLHVEIDLICRRHDQLRALSDRGGGRITLPLLGDSGWVESRLRYLLPADHLLPILVDGCLRALDDSNVLLVGERLYLVAADMEVW